MRDFNCYLFDADGTLFDSTELICRCFTNTSLEMGHGNIDQSVVLSHIGLTLRDQMSVYFGQLSDEQFAQYRKVHMDYQMSIYNQHLSLFEGVKETLEELKQRGKKCAVVTSRFRETLTLFLKETDILSYFDTLVTPEDTPKHKPDPEPAVHAMKLLGAQGSESLFIGDATFDIECGHKAGTSTAFVSWSRNSVDSLVVKPTYIINHMRELCC